MSAAVSHEGSIDHLIGDSLKMPIVESTATKTQGTSSSVSVAANEPSMSETIDSSTVLIQQSDGSYVRAMMNHQSPGAVNDNRPPLYRLGQGAVQSSASDNLVVGESSGAYREPGPMLPLYPQFTRPQQFYSAPIPGQEYWATTQVQLNELASTVKQLQTRLGSGANKSPRDDAHRVTRGHGDRGENTGDTGSLAEGASVSGVNTEVNQTESRNRFSEVSSSSGELDTDEEDDFNFHSLKSRPTAVSANTGSDKLNRLNLMSQEFDEKEIAGPAVNVKLAATIKRAMQVASSPKNIKELSAKYVKPENCESVRAPLVNMELWKNLTENYQQNDKLLAANHRSVSKAMLPIIQIMNSCLEEDKDGNDKVFDMACDAFQLLSHSHRDMTAIRRQMLKPAVARQYQKLCTAKTPISEFLFGDDLQQQMKNLSETNKLASEISEKKTSKRKFPYERQEGSKKPKSNYRDSPTKK